METIIIVIVVGILNLLSFYLGAKIEQGEKIEFQNPVEQYLKYKNSNDVKDAQEKEKKILAQNLANIENYDGTSLGQQDFE